MESVKATIEESFGFQAVDIEDLGIGQGQTGRFRITTNGKKYMAKHYHPKTQLEVSWIGFECKFLNHLKDAGMPIATAIKTRDGRTFALADERPLVLYERVEGSVEWPASLKRREVR